MRLISNPFIMKKALYFFICYIFLSGSLFAQFVVFSEDFEPPSFDDQVLSSSTPGTFNWQPDTVYAVSGQWSIYHQVETGNTLYLTTRAFSTIGLTSLFFSFDQICKVDFLDIATLETSSDNGLTWTQLNGIHYLGSGFYTTNGNRFASNSYGNLWQPYNPAAIPQSSWWRHEIFDLTFLMGYPHVKIRFKLSDAGISGPNNNYGWIIDDILLQGNYGISGHVNYNNNANTPMSDVRLLLMSQTTVVDSCFTDYLGYFEFTNVVPGNYSLLPNTTKPLGGVNSTDALGILQHFIGVQILSGLSLLAADVSYDGNINSLDALFIALRFSGVTGSFPSGDWLFEDPQIAMPVGASTNVNIKCQCYGDINNSNVPPQ